jgi:flavin-dependent dehydrogenase
MSMANARGAVPIEATLAFSEVGLRTWEVIVVGAGPAGSLAARALAQAGAPVLLVDRAAFPRRKVCGSCLNLRTLAVLHAAGLGDLVARLGAVPLGALHLAAQGHLAAVPLPGGVSLSRTAFDAALAAEAVCAGVRFLPETEARLGECSATARGVNLRQNDRTVSVRARVILAADGLGGRLLSREPDSSLIIQSGSRLGAGTVVEEAPAGYASGTIFMACGNTGYVGLVRLEDGSLNVAAALNPDAVRRAGGVGQAAESILEEAGLPSVPRLAAQAWHGTPLLTRRVTLPAAPRVFAVGDAAGYVEPFTGDGIASALESAARVVPLARRGCASWQPGLMREWAMLHRRMVVRRQWLCRVVARALRSPVLVRAALTVLSRAPAVATPFVGYLNQAPAASAAPESSSGCWFLERA